MKKITLKVLLITIAVFSINASAQVCTIDDTGGQHGDYWAETVTTTGATQNLNHSDVTFDVTATKYHAYAGTGNELIATQGANVDFNLEHYNQWGTAEGTSWVRTMVFIDWNGDEDFTTAGDLVATLGAEDTSANNYVNAFSVSVPGTAPIGTVVMRIVTGDAWGSMPNGLVPCTLSGLTYGVKDFNVQITAPLGVNDLERDLQFVAYPNPIKGNSLNLRMNVQNQKVNIELYSITGKLIQEIDYENFNKSERIKLPTLTKGVYLMKVTVGDNKYIKKLVK